MRIRATTLPLRGVAIMAALAGGAALAWLVTPLPERSEDLRSVPFLLTAGLILGSLALERARHDLGFFSPYALTSLAYVLVFAAVPLLDLWNDNPVTHSTAWWWSSWLAFLGGVVMVIGYNVATGWFDVTIWRRGKPALSGPWALGTAQVITGLTLLVGLAGVAVAIGGPGNATRLLTSYGDRDRFVTQTTANLLFAGLAVPALVLSGVSWIRERRLSLLVLLVGVWLPFALIVTGYNGTRYQALSAIIGVVAVVHWGYRRIPGVVIGGLVVALALLFIVASQARLFAGTTERGRPITAGNFYERYLAEGRDVNQFHDLVITVDGVPDRLGFQLGRTFASVVPQLPFETGGNLYSRTFFAKQYADGTSYPTPLPGELYMNFGTPGVLLGMLLFGGGLGVLEAMFRRHPSSTAVFAVYCFSALPTALILRGEFTTLGGTYFVGLGYLVLALRLVTRRSAGATPGRL
jgi:hypothetical protein